MNLSHEQIKECILKSYRNLLKREPEFKIDEKITSQVSTLDKIIDFVIGVANSDEHIQILKHSHMNDISQWEGPCCILNDLMQNESEVELMRFIRPYTMTTPVRIYALINSVKYIVRNSIPGDIVECGVWKGGSMMAIAQTLHNYNYYAKELYLYDTFEGMVKPTNKDINYLGNSAYERFSHEKISDHSSKWAYCSLDEVKQNMKKTNYDFSKMHFIKGMVENTIPNILPKKIALLRLDTDWYESTLHELEHLFPLISPGGVLIIDDYGYWLGSKIATDEYIKKNNIKILLCRIDYAARLAIKQ